MQMAGHEGIDYEMLPNRNESRFSRVYGTIEWKPRKSIKPRLRMRVKVLRRLRWKWERETVSKPMKRTLMGVLVFCACQYSILALTFGVVCSGEVRVES